MIKIRDLFVKHHSDDNYVISKTSSYSCIVTGDDKLNKELNTFLSTNDIVHPDNSSFKMITMAMSSSREEADYLTSSISKIFTELSVDKADPSKQGPITSRDDSNSLIGRFIELKKEVKEKWKDSITAFAFAIKDDNGNLFAYNVGELRIYVTGFQDDELGDLTYADPAANEWSDIRSSNGSYYTYSNIKDVYLTTQDVSLFDLKRIRKDQRTYRQDTDKVLALTDYYYSYGGPIDKAIAVLVKTK